jgi:cytochrome c553
MAMTMADALRLGLEREPARRANAESLFLKSALPPVVDAIKKKDAALFKERFETLRAACTSCHAAEKHAFIRIGLPKVKRNPVE